MSNLKAKVAVMLRMQDALNKQVFPDWKARKLAWHRAIYVEAAEYLEHLGTWKWWKKGVPDYPQANLELVDIWHFGLSWHLERTNSDDPDRLAALLAAQMEHSWGLLERRHGGSAHCAEGLDELRHQNVDALVHEAGDQSFALHAFVALVAYSGMDFDELYRRYVGKNMLNGFRQENGYRTGTYQKTWGGLEDNAHLHEILQDLPADEQLPAKVREALNERYARLTTKA